MLATLLLCAVTAPQTRPLPWPHGAPEFSAYHQIAPDGTVIAEVYGRDDLPHLASLKEGRVKLYPVARGVDFGYEEHGLQGYSVNGVLADGTIFGARHYGFSGASSVFMSVPFVTRNHAQHSIPLPAELKKFNDLQVCHIRPDGAMLLHGCREGLNMMQDDPKLVVDQLFWVKDGRIIQDVGRASDPVLSSDGKTLAATQYTAPDGAVVSESFPGAAAHAVVWRDGRFVRMAEGRAIAVLDSGDIIIHKPGDLSKPLQRFRDGALAPFKFPGQPPVIDEIYLTRRGHGILVGSEPDYKPFIRTFTPAASRTLPLPPGELHITAFTEGRCIVSSTGSDQATKQYIGTIP